MRKIINYFNPNKTPSYLKNSDIIVIWQEKAFQIVLLISAIAAWIGLALINRLQFTENPHLRTILLGYLITMNFILLLRFISFKFRVHVLSSSLTIASFILLQSFGVNGTISLVLICAPLFTGILINFRSAIIYTILNVGVILLTGFGLFNSYFPNPIENLLTNPYTPTNWLTWALFTFVVLLGVLSSINQIFRNYNQTIKKEVHLSKALESERAKLAVEVERQTRSLNEQLHQLQVVAQISSEINRSLNISELLNNIVEIAKKNFDLYYVGIFLLDEFGENAVLRAGSGEEGRLMVANGHHLAVNGPSMIGWATGRKEARIALDVGAEAVHFSNPYLPFTHSEMALPLIGRNERVLGAMTIQSHRQNDFDQDDILIFENVAHSLAFAIENAELFEQSQTALKEIEALNRNYTKKSWQDLLLEHPVLSAEYENQTDLSKSDAKLQTLSIPINLRNQSIGQIDIDVPRTKMNDFEQNLLDALSDQIAIALENARLMEESIRQVEQEQQANQLSTEFFKATKVDDVIRTAIEQIASIPFVSEVNIHIDPSNAGSHKNNGKEG